MSPKLAWSELDSGLESGDWPAWLPYGSCAVVTAATAIAILERQSAPHRMLAVVALAIAYLPFLLDAIGYLTGRNCGLPIWLFPLPVLDAMTYLVLHPVNNDVAPFVLVFMSAEMVSRTTKTPWLGLSIAVASALVVTLPDLTDVTHGMSIWILAIAFASGGGYLVQMLTQRTQQLREAQDDLATKAVADERSRIAREVHDVIAHSMSVTMLHLTAARMALEAGKTDDALEALEEAERQGRTSMSDIRRTVGLLGDSAAAAAPLPSAADLPKLVADFKNAGIDVDLDIEGDFAEIAPAAGLSIYRIVQESLTNVAKHSPGAPTHVRLTVDDSSIDLIVRNERSNCASSSSADGSGMGLKGMVERAALLDGRLTAGAYEGGWVVKMTAPR